MAPVVGKRSGPLQDVLVVDLSSFLAGPFCTEILGDLGARVIKVERRDGDNTRKLPPYYVGGTSAYFHTNNRNKESIVVDLKNPKGRDAILKLVERADVVVENFRPGVMERLGLGYDDLTKVNPRVVMCSISGFGQEGPYRERPAYDMIVQALSGTMSITGEPGRSPVRLGVPLGDVAAGMYGVIGLLAALNRRNVTGRGEWVDVSMLDVQVALLNYLGVYYLVSGEAPGPQGRGHLSIPTYRSFTCSDGKDVIVTANTEGFWQSLCKMLELPELLNDARFATNEDRNRNRGELWPMLEAAFKRRTAPEWLQKLQEFDIPSAPVNSVDRALADPQVQHRNMVVDLSRTDGLTMQLLGNPIKLAGEPAETFTWAPELGEHTRSVFEGLLGMSAAEVTEMERSGIIYCNEGSGNKEGA